MKRRKRKKKACADPEKEKGKNASSLYFEIEHQKKGKRELRHYIAV